MRQGESQGLREAAIVLVRPGQAREDQLPGTLVVEGIRPAGSLEEKRGINTLVGEDPVPPNGGVAFHDIAVRLRVL